METAPPMDGERRLDVPGGSPEPIPGRCGRKRSQGPGYCRKLPVAGRTACYKHGGSAPVGILASNFKHGNYSRYMQLDLAARFTETERDPELLSLRADVALITERVNSLLEQVTSGESGRAWRQVRKIWADVRRFKASGHVARMQEALEQLTEPLEHGIGQHAAWEEVGLQLDRRARLVDQEARRLEKMQATLTVEQALGLLGTVLDVLRRHVTDADVLAAIGADLEQLVALDARSPLAERSRRRRV